MNRRSGRRDRGRGRGRGRRRGRARRGRQRGRRIKRKRTDEEEAAVTKEKECLEVNRLDMKYSRNMVLNLMHVVEDFITHEHFYFLKEAEVTDSWDLEYTLDIDKIEAAQKQFYECFTKFLTSLKHKKHKDKDGNPLGKLHGSLNVYVTAVNNLFRDANRPIPSLFQMM